ncbi:hypothetical protein [Cohnella sp.]
MPHASIRNIVVIPIIGGIEVRLRYNGLGIKQSLPDSPAETGAIPVRS